MMSLATLNRIERRLDEELIARSPVVRASPQLDLGGALRLAFSPGIIGKLDEALEKELVVRAGAADQTAPNANTAHASRAILRTAQLQSVGNWIQQQVDERLADLETSLVNAIREYWKEPPKLFKVAAGLIATAFDGLKEQAERWFHEIAHTVAAKTKAGLAEHHGVEALNGSLSGVIETPVLGATLSEHFDKLASDTLFRFKTLVRQGLMAGDDLDKLVARVDGSGGEKLIKAGEAEGHPFRGNQWTDIDESATLYHATLEGHIPSIKKEGLKTFSEAKKYSGNDYPNDVDGVALGNLEQARVIKRQLEETTGGKARILEVYLKKGTRVHEDSSMPESSVIVPHGIHPKNIRELSDAPAKHQKTNFQEWFRNGKVKAADPTLSEASAADAAKKRFLIQVRMMDTTENSINKVIQAAITAFANEGNYAGAGGSEIEGTETRMGWQWVAVMDAATCEQCEFYDGRQWDKDFQPVGEEGVEYPGDSPLHFNCRCSLVPVDLDGEPPEQDFDEYLAQFSRSEQEAAFGKEVLRAYRRGDISAAQLIGQRENMMTLEQFKNAP